MNYCPTCHSERKLLLVPGGFECQECYATFNIDGEPVDIISVLSDHCKLCGLHRKDHNIVNHPFNGRASDAEK